MSLKPEVLAVGLGAVVLIYLAKRGADAMGKGLDAVGHVVSNDLNPASQNNIVNRGVNALVQTLTGDDKQTLGGWIYDKTHGPVDTGADRIVDGQIVSRTPGVVLRYGDSGLSMNDIASGSVETFDPRNYQTKPGAGSIYDAGFGLNGWGQQTAPRYVGGMGSIANI